MKKRSFSKFLTILLLAVLLTGCMKDGEQGENRVDSQENNIEENLADNELQEHVLEEEETQFQSKEVTILGAEIHTEISGNKNFVDKAEEGYEFLVVYLEIENKSIYDDYFHYDYLSTEIDGNKVDTTYLMNNPKGYTSIFTELPAEGTVQGYLVYHTLVNWQELKISYTGWADEDMIKTLIITKEDIKEVEELEVVN